MGLADDIRKENERLANAAALAERWARTHCSTSSPIVLTPSGDLGAVIREALPMLRVFNKYWIAACPDGTTRLTQFYSKGFLASLADDIPTASVATIVAYDYDKSKYNLYIVRDGRIAWDERVPEANRTAASVRQALITQLSR